VLCSAADDQTGAVKEIQEQVQAINSELYKGQAIQSEPQCGQDSWCEMMIVFTDSTGQVRKVVEWAEGNRQAGSRSSITARSMWEWYYLPSGEAFFVSGRYEGEPGSGEFEEHHVYIRDGRRIHSLWGKSRITSFQTKEPAPNDDVVAQAHEKLAAGKSLLAIRLGSP
jgi:hypothetical protein